ncbi:MAG: hypothetical protein ACP5UJ_08605 [Athalassotoga sp.]|uniref:hypothetical protein n=1 Tax=Athalassotoga sp. TaxID=2022597 RepID=UPI003D0039C3
MVDKILPIPEDSLVSMLKSLPEDNLLELFWKVLVESDVSPLTAGEKKDLSDGIKEFRNGKTIKWEDIK